MLFHRGNHQSEASFELEVSQAKNFEPKMDLILHLPLIILQDFFSLWCSYLVMIHFKLSSSACKILLNMSFPQ